MKKIIFLLVFLFTLSYTFTTNASLINLESTQSFYPNQGVVESKSILIDVSNYNTGSISKNYFTLTLPEDSNIRFSQDYSAINFSWLSASKIWTGITIMPNLRELRFNLLKNFENWDSINISWLKLVVYSKPQWDRNVGIDLDSDGVIDATSSNWYRVYDVNAYSDSLAPSEVFNFTWSIVDNKITVSADMPGDLDFQAILLENLDIFWKVLSSFFKYDLNNFTYDLQPTYNSIRIKAVDIRANYSIWNTYNLDNIYNKNKIIEQVSNTWIVLVSTWTIIWNTWTVLANTWVILNKDIIIEKYVPSFTKQVDLLNRVVVFIDKYIIKYSSWTISVEKNNNVMSIRNQLVKELEKLDVAIIQDKPSITYNIRAFFKQLVIEINK